MKILQINTIYGTSSTGTIVADINKKLTACGHHGLIGYGRGATEEHVAGIRIGTNLDMYLHAIYTRILDKHGFASKRATIDFLRKIEKYNPDIIHLHNMNGYYVNLGELFKWLERSKLPIVWTLHDCWAFTGHCGHFDYVGCNKWKDQCYNCVQKKAYPKSVLIDNSKWNYVHKKNLFQGIIDNLTIIAPSNWLACKVKQSFLKNADIHVIYHGIDINTFTPRKSQILDKYNVKSEFIIIGVANIWTQRKGLNHFLELAKVLPDEFKIILVGLNDKQLKELPLNIIGIKRTNSKEELADLYSCSDLFINFTLEETLGLTNLEALACGTPVLTFNSGGSPECVDETCGFVVEKGDIEAAIDIIYTVKNGSSMSEACVKRAHLFKNDDKFQEHIDLYEKKLQSFLSRDLV